MTSTQPIWTTRRAYNQLLSEFVAQRSRRGTGGPDEFTDYDANLASPCAVQQAHIREVEDLLTNAVIGEGPAGDTVAQAGMVLTIRYEDFGETETFLLGRRGAEDTDLTAYSTLSPLGHAITDAHVGEQRIYSIPHERGVLVTLLEAVPYETYVAKSHRPRSRPGRRHPALPRCERN